MADIRKFNTHIWRASNETPMGLPLHVHLVVGEHYAVWVDSGTAGMYAQLQATMEEAGLSAGDLQLVLQTHPHYDHIGCSGRLRRDTGAMVAGHPSHATWHSDFEAHIRKYALTFPEIIEDSTALRAGIVNHLDEPHPQDINLQEGIVFNLGGCQLKAYHFSGHMAHEMGYFETQSHTLILGDALTLLDAPILFGHVTVGGYRQTLERLEGLLDELEVQQVLLAHYPPQSASQIKDLLAETAEYLNRLDTIVLNLITGHQEIHLRDLWQAVCKTMERRADYRALRTVEAHVRGLIKKGKVEKLEPLRYGPSE